MRTRILITDGSGSFKEGGWEKPDHTDDEIAVKAVMTGICRSDIDMMNGDFGPLPIEMQGHEGLAKVLHVGKNVKDAKVGDYVATRGEPAYADYYNVRKNEYVVVPSADPKYILEPVACGVNLVAQDLDAYGSREGPGKRLLIMGSGFLAWVAYNTIKFNEFEFDITVYGHSNKELWGDVLQDQYTGTFDVVIDLSSNTDLFDKNIVNNGALVVFGVQKQVTTDFGSLLWKACTMMFPSPRQPEFINTMGQAKYMIENGVLDVDKFWTKGYNRDTEWQQAFADGQNRPKGYSRGYIKWD